MLLWQNNYVFSLNSRENTSENQTLFKRGKNVCYKQDITVNKEHKIAALWLVEDTSMLIAVLRLVGTLWVSILRQKWSNCTCLKQKVFPHPCVRDNCVFVLKIQKFHWLERVRFGQSLGVVFKYSVFPDKTNEKKSWKNHQWKNYSRLDCFNFWDGPTGGRTKHKNVFMFSKVSHIWNRFVHYNRHWAQVYQCPTQSDWMYLWKFLGNVL